MELHAHRQFGPTTIHVTVWHERHDSRRLIRCLSANVAPTAAGLTAPASRCMAPAFTISLNGRDVSTVDAGSRTTPSTVALATARPTTRRRRPPTARAARHRYRHTGQSITVKGKVFDKDGGSNEYTASVEILQPEITLTPSSHNYGSVLVGSTSSPTTYTVTNVGTATLTVSSVALGGTSPGHFGIDSNNCAGSNGVLAPNACTVSYSSTL